MSFSLPKIKIANTTIKVPKLSMGKLGFIQKPRIGYPRPVLGNIVKTKIKLK